MPNPSCVSPIMLAQYEWIGKLIGLALRTRFILNLSLPAVFWKALVGEPVSVEDITAIDVLSTNALKAVTNLDPATPPAVFNREMVAVRFNVMGSDSKLHELGPDGNQRSLTFENRFEYAALMKKFRCSEFQTQTNAVRRGLGKVIPLDALGLFTWANLSFLVCGRGMTARDVDLLQRMTSYESGCSAQDEHVKWLFEILREEFDDEQRGLYLSFVWGRSRLPLNSNDFDEKHKIAPSEDYDSDDSDDEGGDKKCDKRFPMGHTCFFQIDLPAYSSKDILMARLLTAITMCGGIDGD